jgi:hypothetical protein
VKPYFLAFLALPILAACSNASGTRTAGSAESAQSADSSQPGTSVQPAVHANTPISGQPSQPASLLLNNDDLSIPPFGLDKVKAALQQMRTVDDSNAISDASTTALSDSAYDALSLDERFTYNMIHAEDYSQMCDGLPAHEDEGGRIYGLTRDFFGEYSWSQRQIGFFNDNRDSVNQLMKRVIDRQGSVGMNFLYIIAKYNAVDLIPSLIKVYRKDNSNHYILTVLMLLMKANNYSEFMQSTSYKKLYSSDDSHNYTAFLNYNKANEDLIIQRATNFYNTRAEATKP